MNINEIKKNSSEIINEVINIRRHFHMNPELSFDEFETSKFIIEKLNSYGIKVFDKIAGTGVVGLLSCNTSKKTIAIRADMDALPVIEMNKHNFVSKNKGIMHACGHDMHMAIALGVAKILSSLKDKLNVNVVFIFQPGEEGYAGAKKMINEGVLTNPRVDLIIATHVSPNYQTGYISVVKGPAMASPSEFKIIVKGKGGHAAQPNKCVNPILIATNLIDLMHKIATPKDVPLESAILTVTSFTAGNTYNIIPEEAKIMGTVRTFNPSLDYQIFRKIESLVETITKTFDVGYKFYYEVGYPPVINDDYTVDLILDSAKNLIENDKIISNDSPLMLAEDFAYYTQKIPGAIFHLGCAKDEISPNLHSNKFDPDENCLKFGIDLMVSIVFNYQNKGNC